MHPVNIALRHYLRPSTILPIFDGILYSPFSRGIVRSFVLSIIPCRGGIEYVFTPQNFVQKGLWPIRRG